MSKHISVGLATFEKSLGDKTVSRAVFHAEYDPVSRKFTLTQSLFIERRGRIHAVAKHDIPCSGISEVLERLSTATLNAVEEGFKFDLPAFLLLGGVDPDDDDDDETWTDGLTLSSVATGRLIKPKN